MNCPGASPVAPEMAFPVAKFSSSSPKVDATSSIHTRPFEKRALQYGGEGNGPDKNCTAAPKMSMPST